MNWPRHPLPVRLPAPHRLHLPLHARPPVDVARSATKACPASNGSRPHAASDGRIGPSQTSTPRGCTSCILTTPTSPPPSPSPEPQPGILTPYQERPQVHPVELRLHIDPARDNGRLFPLLMAVGTDRASATSAALAASLAEAQRQRSRRFTPHTRDSYKNLLAHAVSISTPDKSLDEAFQWAVVSIEQLRTSVFEPAKLSAELIGLLGPLGLLRADSGLVPARRPSGNG